MTSFERAIYRVLDSLTDTHRAAIMVVSAIILAIVVYL